MVNIVINERIEKSKKKKHEIIVWIAVVLLAVLTILFFVFVITPEIDKSKQFCLDNGYRYTLPLDSSPGFVICCNSFCAEDCKAYDKQTINMRGEKWA